MLAVLVQPSAWGSLACQPHFHSPWKWGWHVRLRLGYLSHGTRPSKILRVWFPRVGVPLATQQWPLFVSFTVLAQGGVPVGCMIVGSWGRGHKVSNVAHLPSAITPDVMHAKLQYISIPVHLHSTVPRHTLPGGKNIPRLSNNCHSLELRNRTAQVVFLTPRN